MPARGTKLRAYRCNNPLFKLGFIRQRYFQHMPHYAFPPLLAELRMWLIRLWGAQILAEVAAWSLA